MPASRFAAWAGTPTKSEGYRGYQGYRSPNPSVSAALEAARRGNPRREAEGYQGYRVEPERD